MKGRNPGFVLAGIYLAAVLFLLSFLFIGPSDALNGFPAMVATLPWSLMLLKLLPHATGGYSTFFGAFVLLVAAGINALLLFVFAWCIKVRR